MITKKEYEELKNMERGVSFEKMPFIHFGFYLWRFKDTDYDLSTRIMAFEECVILARFSVFRDLFKKHVSVEEFNFFFKQEEIEFNLSSFELPKSYLTPEDFDKYVQDRFEEVMNYLGFKNTSPFKYQYEMVNERGNQLKSIITNNYFIYFNKEQLRCVLKAYLELNSKSLIEPEIANKRSGTSQYIAKDYLHYLFKQIDDSFLQKIDKDNYELYEEYKNNISEIISEDIFIELYKGSLYFYPDRDTLVEYFNRLKTINYKEQTKLLPFTEVMLTSYFEDSKQDEEGCFEYEIFSFLEDIKKCNSSLALKQLIMKSGKAFIFHYDDNETLNFLYNSFSEEEMQSANIQVKYKDCMNYKKTNITIIDNHILDSNEKHLLNCHVHPIDNLKIDYMCQNHSFKKKGTEIQVGESSNSKTLKILRLIRENPFNYIDEETGRITDYGWGLIEINFKN